MNNSTFLASNSNPVSLNYLNKENFICQFLFLNCSLRHKIELNRETFWLKRTILAANGIRESAGNIRCFAKGVFISFLFFICILGYYPKMQVMVKICVSFKTTNSFWIECESTFNFLLNLLLLLFKITWNCSHDTKKIWFMFNEGKLIFYQTNK